MKQSRKGAKAHTKITELGHKDRRSGTGMSGSPKKGGHGGKFTWSGDGGHLFPAEIAAAAVDVKDPNFEDPDEAE